MIKIISRHIFTDKYVNIYHSVTIGYIVNTYISIFKIDKQQDRQKWLRESKVYQPINNWFILSVHYRVMEHAGSLESTKEA